MQQAMQHLRQSFPARMKLLHAAQETLLACERLNRAMASDPQSAAAIEEHPPAVHSWNVAGPDAAGPDAASGLHQARVGGGAR